MARDLFVDSDGIRLAVRDYGGSGWPVVLVHGHYGNLGSFDYLGPALAADLRVVAYDQRGHGWSESGEVSVRAFADDLAAVIAALDLGDPVLYGGSFGTLVCLGYFNARGRASGFISEDGRVSDYPGLAPAPQPPPATRRILAPQDWAAVRHTFAAAGPTGEATADRSVLERPDGTVEVRPSAQDLFDKEAAFTTMAVPDAWARGPEAKLLLASEHVPDLAGRRGRIETLQSVTAVEVQWFATGHWISAEDTEGVAHAVVDFVERVRRDSSAAG